MSASQVGHSSRVRISIALVIAIVSLTALVARSGYRFFDWRTRDTTADQLMTRAAFAGDDPYGDLEQLGAKYGVPYRLVTQIGSPKTEPAVAFRPPGAFFVLAPFLLSSAAHAYSVNLVANAMLLIALALMTSRIAGIRTEFGLLVVPLLMMTKPVMGSFEWGTQSILVAVLIAGAWLGARSGALRTAGIAVAVAATLKLFPLLLIIPLLSNGKRRAAVWAGAGFVVLQLLALVSFRGIRWARLFSRAKASARFWGPARPNGSLAGVLTRGGADWSFAVGASVVLAVVLGVIMWKRTRSFDERFAGTLIVAILLSPLSWIHYDAALIPVAAWGFRRGHTHKVGTVIWMLGSLFGWLFLTWLPGGDTDGAVYAIARLALLGGIITALPHGKTRRAPRSRTSGLASSA